MTSLKSDSTASPAAARLVSQEELFKRYRRLVLFRIAPRSLKHDGWAPEIEREVLMTGKVAAVIPYIPESDQILLVRQFRIGALASGAENPFLYEIPAGFIDEGETPEDCARREGLEESGAEITALEYIGHFYPSPGGTTENNHLYVGRIQKPQLGVFGLEEEGEEIQTHLFPAQKVFDMLDSGEITNGTAALSLNWFARHRERIRRNWMGA